MYHRKGGYLENTKEVQACTRLLILPRITYFKNPANRDRVTSKWRQIPIVTEELTTITTSWQGIVFSHYKS